MKPQLGEQVTLGPSMQLWGVQWLLWLALYQLSNEATAGRSFLAGPIIQLWSVERLLWLSLYQLSYEATAGRAGHFGSINATLRCTMITVIDFIPTEQWSHSWESRSLWVHQCNSEEYNDYYDWLYTNWAMKPQLAGLFLAGPIIQL